MSDDCRCGHGFHGHFYCWNTDCECSEQRDAPTLAEVWDEGYAAGQRDGGDNYGWGEDQPEANPYRLSPTGDDSE